MRRALSYVSVAFGSLFAASMAFAQAAEHGSAAGGLGLIALGSALAVGIATFGAASGQGRAAAAALEGIARNPGSRDQVFVPMILGLAFIEFQALLGFIIAILWFGKAG